MNSKLLVKENSLWNSQFKFNTFFVNRQMTAIIYTQTMYLWAFCDLNSVSHRQVYPIMWLSMDLCDLPPFKSSRTTEMTSKFTEYLPKSINCQLKYFLKTISLKLVVSISHQFSTITIFKSGIFNHLHKISNSFHLFHYSIQVASQL